MTRTYGNFTDFIDFSRASSGTYLGSGGLLKTAADNVPRIEYDANGVVKGLLIEEARTNSITYSEDFSQGSWVKTTVGGGTVSVTPSSYQTPDGGYNGYEVLNLDTVNERVDYVSSVAAVDGATWTYSAWLRGSGLVRITLNTSTGVGGGAEIDVPLTNEWVRHSVTNTFSSPTGNVRAHGVITRVTGTAPEVHIWGAQLEQGSFPTSYIPTSGATATRSADIADIATANFGYNPKAGTVVVDFNLINTPFTNFSRVFEFGNSGGSSSIGLLGTKNTNNLYGSINYSGAEQLSYNDVFKAVSEGTSKVSVSYTENDYAINIDGSQLAGDTSVLIPTGLATLYLGKDRSGTGNQINGHIKSIKYIPRRNTNTQLQEFTS